MSSVGFAGALEALGIHCEVEEQGKLAVIVLLPPAPDAVLRSEATKDPSLALRMTGEIISLGRRHGYTNVCLELPVTDAVVSGD
jgi:hypothetical protein